MRADPFAQLKLLDLQTLDTQLDTLRHQLGALPEIAEVASIDARLRALNDEQRDLVIAVDDLTAEQKKADRDVEQVKARRQRDQGLIDSGSVANPKDLERMLHELESLERRISDLEDVEIEVMERLEAAQQQLAERSAEVEKLRASRAGLDATLGRRAAELGERQREVTAERTVTADGVPAELLALYERLRASKGGVGAALLRARQCGGCHLSLDAAELGVIARTPADEVVRCEECDRILVRTGESGL